MKINKLLIPFAVGLTASSPVVVLTACSCGKGNISIDNKELTSGNSVAYYTFKMNSKPSDSKVTVNVINKNASQEQVVLYTGTNTAKSVAEYTVSDDKTFKVPAGYWVSPTSSASSEFSLMFTYKDGNNEKTETIKELKFNYSVDYGTNLKAGYTPSSNVPDATHWTTSNATVGEIYTADVLANPSIFQDDARYSTYQRIKTASDKWDVTNFQAYFNDIVKDNLGLHLHMNYQLAGNKFSFTQGTQSTDPTYTFTDFDCKFTFETPNGYTIEKASSGHETGTKKLIIADPSGNYLLDGRFDGTFKYEITQTGKQTITGDVTYHGLIDNYSIFPKNEYTWDDAQISGMFSFGILCLTYGFDWASAVELSIQSNYAKNAA